MMGSHHLLPGGIDQGDRNRFFENATYSCYPRWSLVLKDFWITLKAHFKRDAFHKCMKSLTCPRKSRSGMSPQLPSGSRPGAGDFGEWRRSRGSLPTGNFSRGVERFYADLRGHPTDNTGLSCGEALAVGSVWGSRAEDPFRGLRAGPVRCSPLYFRRGDPGRPSGSSLTPKNTHQTYPHTAAVFSSDR